MPSKPLPAPPCACRAYHAALQLAAPPVLARFSLICETALRGARLRREALGGERLCSAAHKVRGRRFTRTPHPHLCSAEWINGWPRWMVTRLPGSCAYLQRFAGKALQLLQQRGGMRTTALSVSRFTAADSTAGSASRMRRTAAEQPPHFMPRTSSTTVAAGSADRRVAASEGRAHSHFDSANLCCYLSPIRSCYLLGSTATASSKQAARCLPDEDADLLRALPLLC